MRAYWLAGRSEMPNSKDRCSGSGRPVKDLSSGLVGVCAVYVRRGTSGRRDPVRCRWARVIGVLEAG
jgi:hypothetical protein